MPSGGVSCTSSIHARVVSFLSVGGYWCLPLRVFLFFRASEAATAGPLLRAMRLVVVDLGRVGPLTGLFPLLVSGPVVAGAGGVLVGFMGRYGG